MSNSDNLNDELSQLLESAQSSLSDIEQQQKREDEFAPLANERFQNNLLAFQKYYPDIYNAIENFVPREDFCLHVTKEMSANFVKQGETIPMYSDSPLEQCKEQVEKNLASPAISAVKYDYRNRGDKKDDRIHTKHMNIVSELLAQTRESKPKALKAIPERFPSAMVFGVGLGYHLPILFEHTTFDYIFIVEPDFELFYASLFCIEWDKLIEKVDKELGCMFIHLGITYEEFFDDLFKVVKDIGAFSITRTFCYQHYPNTDLNKLIQDFFAQYFKLQNGFGFYNDAITSISHTIAHMESGANFWESDKHVPEAMQDVPVFVIGNGPSLDDAEELLKHYQNDAIILAAGTALGSLLKIGIQPDFHVLIERPRRNYDILVDTLPKEEYAKLNLLSTNVIYEDTPKLYKWSGLALKGAEAGSDYYALLRIGNFKSRQDIIPYSNPLVANTAMSFASSFGFKNIYLFGVDNGTPESGEHHSKYSIYNDKSLKGKYKAKGGYKHKVKGNLGGTVLANSMYMISRFQMEQLVAYRPEANFYNVGQGAYIKGAYPLKEEDVVLESLGREKQQLVEEIKATQFSPNTVIDEDYKVLDLDAFEEIGNNILSITEEEFSTREECADILRRQARYVYSLRGGRYTHYYHLFKGSLLYYHCPLITLLYSYEDDDFTIAKTKEAMKMWNDYIKDILQDFPKNYKTKCDWGLE